MLFKLCKHYYYIMIENMLNIIMLWIFIVIGFNCNLYSQTVLNESQISETKNISSSATTKEDVQNIVKDIQQTPIIPVQESKNEYFSFGSYKIHFGAWKPKFTDLDQYDLFYKDSSIALDLGVDYYILKKIIGLGLGLKLGYYSDSGNAYVYINNELIKDSNTKLNLTIIPIQANIILQLTPFFYKWVVVGGSVGIEQAYFQESRTLLTDTTLSSDSDDKKYYVNALWKKNKVLGGFLSFKINFLDYKSTASLSMINIENVYLTFYVNQISKLKSSDNGISIARQVYGVNFSFETF